MVIIDRNPPLPLLVPVGLDWVESGLLLALDSVGLCSLVVQGPGPLGASAHVGCWLVALVQLYAVALVGGNSEV